MLYNVQAYVVTADGRQDKSFESKSARGARWMAVRWINKTGNDNAWGWEFRPIYDAWIDWIA